MLVRALSCQREIKQEIKRIGADTGSLPYFANKSEILYFKAYGLRPGAANILKQELLSRGGDLIVHKDCVTCKVASTDALLMGTVKTFRQLLDKLDHIPYGNLPRLKEALALNLDLAKERKQDMILPRTGKSLNVWGKPLVMGVANLTPDSFYPDSRITDRGLLLKKIEEMINAGVDIVDLGGESTRPGSERVPLEEELDRIIPAVELIRKNLDIPISIDTYKSEIARRALDAGADIINDISGLTFDTHMAKVVSDTKAPVIIMHIQGEPKHMQKDPFYTDVVKELCEYFSERIQYAEESGIGREQIILDPGIGFGKRLQDNLEILKYLDEFKIFGSPVLIGVSRKSFIGDVLQLPVDKRLEGTLAATAIAIDRGANILRVHDVGENRRFIDMLHACKEI